MQKAFTAPNCTPDTLPSSEAIKELQTEYTNMLTAIIDLLDGAKYLWEEDRHEQQSWFQFAMYESATDSIIINTGENAILVICCKECNSSVIYDDPNDIVYLYRLAEETPLLYAKLALKENGLQDYVDAMNEFN